MKLENRFTQQQRDNHRKWGKINTTDRQTGRQLDNQTIKWKLRHFGKFSTTKLHINLECDIKLGTYETPN